jgi:diaminopimelate decarboxylase
MSALTKYHNFFSKQKTPFYFYDTALLKDTLRKLKDAAGDYLVHYAMKANTNDVLLKIIKEAGLGADCVSGNEIKKAVECNFSNKKIVHFSKIFFALIASQFPKLRS